MNLSQKLKKAPWHLRYRTGAKLASDIRKLMIRLTHRHCRVEFQGPVYLGPGFHLNIPDRGEFIVGPGVDFRRGFVCEISGDGRVEIGAGATFTSHALIQCTTSISIGKRTVFGQALMIADGSHRFGDPSRHVLDQGYDYNAVSIGDNAVVMTKVTIVADIGDGAFVGANSLVNKPVPAHCFAGGVPAKVIREFVSPEEIQALADSERG